MSLRAKIIGLTALVFILVLAASWLAFDRLRGDVVSGLGSTYAEKQVLYNRERTLHPLMRELALAEKLADSTMLRAWALDENNPDKRSAGLRELEDFRRVFADQSYFFVPGSSLHYYFNDRDNTYAGQELRYTLDPADPEDEWYFATIQTGEPYKLNVNYDAELEVTKVWMNLVIREGADVLGVVGTGIDLSEFLKNVVSSDQKGVTNMFVDEGGALQAHDRVDLIDFHSISKDPSEQKTIFLMLDSDADRRQVQAAMDRLRADPEKKVETAVAHLDGKEYLVGLSYLGEIGWFGVTLMDTGQLVGASRFITFAVLLVAALLILSVGLVIMLNRLLVGRIRRLDTWVRQFSKDASLVPPITKTGDEIGRLEEGFEIMAGRVRESTDELESKVASRTKELSEKNERLLRAIAEIETLSGLLPICMHCKKIRDESTGEWSRLEDYIGRRSKARFSHGICPECETEYGEDGGSGHEPE